MSAARNASLVAVGGILLLAGGVLASDPATAPSTRPAPRLTIGRDTTRITGPLRPDGTLDYLAALNVAAGQGVTPENNAAVLLVRVLDPGKRPNAVEHRRAECKALGVPVPPGPFLVRPKRPEAAEVEGAPEAADELNNARLAPWRADEHPWIATWLKEGEPQLAIAIEAMSRPRFYLPLVATEEPAIIANALEWPSGGVTALGDALCTRAMLRLGSGDFDGCRSDLVSA
jgi:hypothetical protein